MNNAFDPTQAYKTFEQAVTKNQEAFQTILASNGGLAKQFFGQNLFDPSKMKMGDLDLSASYQQFLDQNRSRVDQMLELSNRVAKNAESLNEVALAANQRNIEEGINAVKAISGAKDFSEVVTSQGEYVRSATENLVSGTAKLSDLAAELLRETFATLQNVSTKVAEAATTPAKKSGKAAAAA